MFKEISKAKKINKVMKGHAISYETIKKGERKLKEILRIWTRWEIDLYLRRDQLGDRGTNFLAPFFEDVEEWLRGDDFWEWFSPSFIHCLELLCNYEIKNKSSFLDQLYFDLKMRHFDQYDDNPFPRLTRGDLGL